MTRILKDRDREIIKEKYWSKLISNIQLVYFNSRDEKCKSCNTLSSLYTELADISDKISFKLYYLEESLEIASKYKVKKAPALVLLGKNKGLIKFYGAPAGMKFPFFIETIVLISRGETQIDHILKQKIINEITKEVNIKVFTTPTCPYCPQMANIACQFAILNSYLDVEIWEALEFPEEVKRYNIMAVPKVVINDIISFEGLISPNDLFEKIKIALR